MMTSVCIHLQEDTEAKVTVRTDYAVIKIGESGGPNLFFISEEHLRSFAENILLQLDGAKELSA